MKKDSIIFYTSQFQAIESLTDEQLGRLFRALFQKQLGKEVVLGKDIEIAFRFINNQMVIDNDKYTKRCEKNRENGKKGGAPKGNQNARKQPKQPNGVKNNPNDNENDNENDNDNDNDLKKKNIQKKNFTKPSLEEVRAYCEERKNGIDTESFIDFYESKGWKVGKDPMKDWKACVRTWERRRKEKQQTTMSWQERENERIKELGDKFLRGD